MFSKFLSKIFSFIIISFLVLFSACSKNASFKLQNLKDSSVQKIEEKTVKNKDVVTKAYFFENKISSPFALKVNLKLDKNAKIEKLDSNKFVFGFLYDEDNDFKNLASRSIVSGNFDDILIDDEKFEEVSLSLCSKDDKKTVGFFIQSYGNVNVTNAFVDYQKIGFDYSSKIPEFAFDVKGGKVDSKKNLNLLNFAETFDSIPLNALEICVKFSKNADFTGKTSSVLSVNKEKFYVRCPKLKNDETIADLDFPLSAVKNPLGELSIIENPSQLDSVMLKINQNELKAPQKKIYNHFLTPIKVDPGLVMWWPKKNWRGADYELFEWDRFPGVLLMDIENYNVQDDFFRRLAFYVEKAGFRGKLYSDSFLEGRHAYNAHDYKAESLADFYEKVRIENFKLNDKELLLKEILLENGIIEEKNGKFVAGRGAVISISQESKMYLRSQFIAHEGWHGIFFVDEDFRKFVYDEYEKLDAGSKAYLIRYFQVTPSLNYDVEDPYLLRNEFMAYMLQKPVSDISKYFVDMAGREHSQYLAKKEADYILSNRAKYFVEASKRLDKYVNDRWNLNAGRVWLLN